MFTAIASGIANLLGFGTEFVKGKNEIDLKKIQAKVDNEIRTLDSKAEWEITAMKSARYLRWVIIVHVFAGMDASIYMALSGHRNPMIIMDILAELPLYYQGFIGTIIGFAFASEPLKNAGAKAITALMKRK